MTSQLEIKASKLSLARLGYFGTKLVMPLDDNKIVASTNMKATAHTMAAQPDYPCRITAKVTAVGTADTLGNLVIVGKLTDGTVCTEEVELKAGETVESVNEFSVITSVTTPSWVIDVGTGNDTIIIGTGATTAGEDYYISHILTLADSVVASQTGTSADLSKITSISKDLTIPVNLSSISLTSGEAIAYLCRK